MCVGSQQVGCVPAEHRVSVLGQVKKHGVTPDVSGSTLSAYDELPIDVHLPTHDTKRFVVVCTGASHPRETGRPCAHLLPSLHLAH